MIKILPRFRFSCRFWSADLCRRILRKIKARISGPFTVEARLKRKGFVKAAGSESIFISSAHILAVEVKDEKICIVRTPAGRYFVNTKDVRFIKSQRPDNRRAFLKAIHK